MHDFWTPAAFAHDSLILLTPLCMYELVRTDCVQSGLLRPVHTGVVFQWFSSYLSDRTFQVSIVCSAPQGSVLGPRLFILYTSDLADAAKAYGVSRHSYTDDTQLHLQCHRREMTTAVQRLEMCITDVIHWMAANRLKLNIDKTEVLWAGSKYGSTPLGSNGPPLQLGDEIITPRDHVRGDLSPEKHVSITSLTCFYWLRQLRRVRRSLNTESAKTLVHAFITTRVDGNNAMLAGSSRTVTDRLQRVLNAAARIVSGTRKFDRGLTHLLHSELNWLDVPERIQHKLVHRCLQGKAPQYLIECCTPTSEVASRQRLRSASRHQLVVPRHRRSKFGNSICKKT